MKKSVEGFFCRFDSVSPETSKVKSRSIPALAPESPSIDRSIDPSTSNPEARFGCPKDTAAADPSFFTAVLRRLFHDGWSLMADRGFPGPLALVPPRLPAQRSASSAPSTHPPHSLHVHKQAGKQARGPTGNAERTVAKVGSKDAFMCALTFLRSAFASLRTSCACLLSRKVCLRLACGLSWRTFAAEVFAAARPPVARGPVTPWSCLSQPSSSSSSSSPSSSSFHVHVHVHVHLFRHVLPVSRS